MKRGDNMSIFDELNSINVNDHTEKKNGLTYLSWSWAWAEVMKKYPSAKYEIKMFDGKPYLEDENLGYIVMTSMEIDGVERTMWLPVMDGANKAMKSKPYTYQVKDYRGGKWTGEWKDKTVDPATMFDINTAIMRCLVKNIAMFGLGLYIYSGEDLPPEKPKTLTKAQISTLEKCIPKHNQTVENVCSFFKVKELSELTVDQFDVLMRKMGEE